MPIGLRQRDGTVQVRQRTAGGVRGGNGRPPQHAECQCDWATPPTAATPSAPPLTCLPVPHSYQHGSRLGRMGPPSTPASTADGRVAVAGGRAVTDTVKQAATQLTSWEPGTTEPAEPLTPADSSSLPFLQRGRRMRRLQLQPVRSPAPAPAPLLAPAGDGAARRARPLAGLMRRTSS